MHLLGEPGRGPALEAGVVSRIKMVSKRAEMQQVGVQGGQAHSLSHKPAALREPCGRSSKRNPQTSSKMKCLSKHG